MQVSQLIILRITRVNVVDSLQRPLKNQVVSLSVQPVAYKLGYLTWNGGINQWVKTENQSHTHVKEFSTGTMCP